MCTTAVLAVHLACSCCFALGRRRLLPALREPCPPAAPPPPPPRPGRHCVGRAGPHRDQLPCHPRRLRRAGAVGFFHRLLRCDPRCAAARAGALLSSGSRSQPPCSGACFIGACHPPAAPPPQVTLTGGEGTPARVVGYDQDKDVAVLKMDPKDSVRESCWLGAVSALQGGQCWPGGNGLIGSGRRGQQTREPGGGGSACGGLLVRYGMRTSAVGAPARPLGLPIRLPSLPPRAGRPAQAAAAGQLGGAGGGAARVCHRQPVWPGPHPDHGRAIFCYVFCVAFLGEACVGPEAPPASH